MIENLGKLNTEQQNPNTLDIDRVSTEEMLAKINAEDSKIAGVVKEEIPSIAKLIDKAYECVKNGGRILYVGAGTSGRLGILDASECPPTYGVSDELVQGVIAGGTPAIFKAQEGAEDSKELAVNDLKERKLSNKDIVIGLAASPAIFKAQEGAEDSKELAVNDLKERKLSNKDIVIGLAASGRTPYVIGALEYANEIGAATGSVSCVDEAQLSKIAKFPVEVVTGAEVVTGSWNMLTKLVQRQVA